MARKPRSINHLSLDKLVAMRDQLQAAIEAKVAEEQRALEGRISELAAVASNAITAARKKRDGHAKRVRGRITAKTRTNHPTKGSIVPTKYRGPNGETWSGRGLTPRWLAALEKSGKRRDAFLVDA